MGPVFGSSGPAFARHPSPDVRRSLGRPRDHVRHLPEFQTFGASAARPARLTPQYTFPIIQAILNDGSKTYDVGKDGAGQEAAQCSVRRSIRIPMLTRQIDYRKAEVATKLKLTYFKNHFLDVRAFSWPSTCGQTAAVAPLLRLACRGAHTAPGQDSVREVGRVRAVLHAVERHAARVAVHRLDRAYGRHQRCVPRPP